MAPRSPARAGAVVQRIANWQPRQTEDRATRFVLQASEKRARNARPSPRLTRVAPLGLLAVAHQPAPVASHLCVWLCVDVCVGGGGVLCVRINVHAGLCGFPGEGAQAVLVCRYQPKLNQTKLGGLRVTVRLGFVLVCADLEGCSGGSGRVTFMIS